MVLKIGNNGNNDLYGEWTDDILKGLGGNDTLFGAGGDDQMYGGLGNDSYYVTEWGDVVTEAANEGVDTVYTSVNGYSLTANVETLIIAEIGGAIGGFGNNLNNVLAGNSSDNALYGLAGNDLINGGAGADEMYGGSGNDGYFVDDMNDSVIENADAGHDIVYATTSYSLAGQDDVEELRLLGSAGVSFAEGNDGDNTLVGNNSDNLLKGGGGHDTLDGGLGDDTMVGGNGSDDYYVRDAGDWVMENELEGNDLVYSAISYTLPDHVEDLSLSLSDAAIDGTGNGLDNAIYGNDNDNVIEGLDGDDFLVGKDGNDIIYGGSGHDMLSGNAGVDVMYGGSGNDDFSVMDADDEVHGGWGHDTVFTNVDFVLSVGTEDLVMASSTAFNATGSSDANEIWANSNANIISGAAGNDILHAGAGNDVIDGGSGSDTLIGEAGRDTMSGGANADFFVWSAANETGLTEGTADVITDFSFVVGDRIDLADIDADVYAAADQAFTFIGQAAFSGTPGEINYYHSGGNTYIQLQTGTSGDVEGVIRLDGIHDPEASWFFL